MANIISNINEYPEISTPLSIIIDDRIKSSHYENETYGSEFIDDLIRTKEQPFCSLVLNEDE